MTMKRLYHSGWDGAYPPSQPEDRPCYVYAPECRGKRGRKAVRNRRLTYMEKMARRVREMIVSEEGEDVREAA